jgi:hypothetical protein
MATPSNRRRTPARRKCRTPSTEAQKKGYFGQKVDPLPNSAHSLESGPDAPPWPSSAPPSRRRRLADGWRRRTERQDDRGDDPRAGDRRHRAGQVISEAPFAGTVTAVRLIPEANLTADNTNNRTFRVLNKGQSGAGTTVVASYQSNVAGGNLVAFDEKALTLSGVAANLVVAAGRRARRSTRR